MDVDVVRNDYQLDKRQVYEKKKKKKGSSLEPEIQEG